MRRKITFLIRIGLLSFGLSNAAIGEINFALKFDGVDDFVHIWDDPSLDLTTGITIEAWIKVENATARHMHFVSKNEGFGAPDKAYALQTDGVLRPYLFMGQICFGWINPPPLTSDVWVHLAGTFDGSTRKFYINGQLQYSVACDPGSVLQPNGLPLLLGKLNNFGQHFEGNMDEVRIWEIARTHQEILGHMCEELDSAECNNPDLVAYWSFNEAAGQQLIDRSTYNNDGRLGSSGGSDGSDPVWVVSSVPVGVDCPKPKTIINPDTMYAFQVHTIDTTLASVYFGDFVDGHTVNDIDTTSMLVNGSMTPVSWQILPSHPGFASEVMEVTVTLRDFILSYGPLWDTTIHDYSVSGLFNDSAAFLVSGEVTMIGHTSGDVNSDGIVNVGDLAYLLEFLFRGGAAPPVMETADLDHSGFVNIADVTALVNFLFR